MNLTTRPKATMQASLDDHARHRRDSHGPPAGPESFNNEDDQESLHALLSENDSSFEREGEHVFPRVVEHTKWWKIYLVYSFFMWNTRTFEYVSVGISSLVYRSILTWYTDYFGRFGFPRQPYSYFDKVAPIVEYVDHVLTSSGGLHQLCRQSFVHLLWARG